MAATQVEQFAAKGSTVLQENQLFCEQRSCKDVFWALAFWIVALCVIFGAVWSSLLVFSVRADDQVLVLTEGTFKYGLQAVVLAGLASTVFSMLFLQLAKRKTECVVWTALLLGPCCAIVMGLALMVTSWPMPGLIGLAVFCMGVCFLSCTMCCLRDLVPATVVLLKTVLQVLERHPSMMILCLVSSLIQLAWQVACTACLIGAAIQSEEVQYLLDQKTSGSPQKAVFLFVLALVYVWGSLVTVNAAFTACAGVYGRWYFDKDSGAPVSTSLREAWSTSFGSICYGSFIVALVRAVQFVVKSLRQEAARDQNYVLCVLLCIVECMIDCVGDILEFVSEMAYVQCAVRGLGFCQACAATCALVSQRNLSYIFSSFLIESVPVLGSLIVGLLSGVVGLLAYHLSTGLSSWEASIFGCSFFVGGFVAFGCLMPLKSGAVCLVICHAEDESLLSQKGAELHRALMRAWDSGSARDVEMQEAQRQ